MLQVGKRVPSAQVVALDKAKFGPCKPSNNNRASTGSQLNF